jgi:GT2 family glycosyltransferase
MEDTVNFDIADKTGEKRQKISAVVISYNRVDLIGTCLRALAFADEVLVVDKSSDDGTTELAASLADRVISVPWSPVVEDTRALAVNECKHDWILCLDDDECLSVEAVQFIEQELRAPRADVYALPLRHYIVGIHDESAYYWPEYHPRLFRRNAVSLTDVVHAGVQATSQALYQVPSEGGVCIHHLSHASVEQWIEKSNRYTSQPNRARAEDGSYDLAAFAHSRIEAFVAATKTSDRGGYATAVAVLRSTYDIIDRLKVWEAEEGLDGAAQFAQLCRDLEQRYATELPRATHRSVVLPPPLQGEPARHEKRLALPSPNSEEAVATLRESIRLIRILSETARKQADAALTCEKEASEKERADHRRAITAAAVATAEEARRLSDEGASQRARLEEKLATAKATLSRVLGERVSRISEVNAEARAMELRAIAAEVNQAREAAARVNAEVQLRAVTSSEFWRLTSPLRSIVEKSRKSFQLQKARANLLLGATIRGDRTSRALLSASLRRRMGADAKSFSAPIGQAETNIHSRAATPSSSQPPHEAAVSSYGEWRKRFDTPGVDALRAIEVSAAEIPDAVLVVRFSRDSLALAGQTIDALRAIIGLNWSAHLVFEPGCDAASVLKLRASVQEDSRFAVDGTLGANFNFAILLEGGAIPRAYGPRLLVQALVDEVDSVISYSDEDKLSTSGVSDPWFKPQFSPLLIEQGILLGRMVGVRLDSEASVHLRLHATTPSADINAMVRGIAIEAGDGRVVHVPHVLFHNLLATSARLALPASELTDFPVASVLIPTRDGWHLLGPCLESLKSTDWPMDRLEIIVIDNGSTDPETLRGMEEAERQGRIKVLRDPRPFNYAQLNNDAARASKGDLLVLLNNDTEIADPRWLKKLAAYAMLPGVGAVGPKLLYGDGTVQHAGVILGIQGLAAHAHLFLGSRDEGYQGLANMTHEVSAVTGACLAVKRTAFEEVGGLKEQFRVAFNDVVFCLDLLDTGRKNIYLAEPLVVHHESKTRGYDDKPEKVRLLRKEARLAWSLHFKRLRNDPYYSPNLSFETPYSLSFAPRRRPAWDKAPRPLRVMMLSSTHARGHGVAVVIDLQARALVERGHEVIIAGAGSANDFEYPGCDKIVVHDPRSAATIAAEKSVDVVIAHTPPYFDVARWTGSYPPVIAYDYGEPPPEFFPDAVARQEGLDSKDLSLRTSYRVLAISESVAAESTVPPHGVVPLGNGHLGRWDSASAERRVRVRRERRWDGFFVILNVCRFHQGERFYKGVDEYAEMRRVLELVDPVLAARTVFVLCGKGDADDVALMRMRGLTVLANVTDAEMADLYAAADLYANFSRWEGYNLGIGQALAMGLPVIASDIPAHRAFGVQISKDAADAAMHVISNADAQAERTPRIWEWDQPLASFVAEIESVAK